MVGKIGVVSKLRAVYPLFDTKSVNIAQDNTSTNSLHVDEINTSFRNSILDVATLAGELKRTSRLIWEAQLLE